MQNGITLTNDNLKLFSDDNLKLISECASI